jgi:hypothetical protein
MKRPPMNLNAAIKLLEAISLDHLRGSDPGRPLEVHGVVPSLAGARARRGQQACCGGTAQEVGAPKKAHRAALNKG